MMSLGLVGAGQFAGQFAKLFRPHPEVGDIYVTDLVAGACRRAGPARGAGRVPSPASRTCWTPTSTPSPSSPSAGPTARWSCGRCAPASMSTPRCRWRSPSEEIAAIIEAVRETGLTYMMGETSYYNPATVYRPREARRGRLRPDLLRRGRLRPRHGSRLLRRLPVQRRRGLEGHRQLPADALPDPLRSAACSAPSADPRRQRQLPSASDDQRGDGVFDRTISQFDNDFSNATALFELADGAIMRINEMRRVGYPSHLRESRFRYFGTEASFEQLATVSLWQDKQGVTDVSELVDPVPTMSPDDPSLADVAPELRDAFISGLGPGARHARGCRRSSDGAAERTRGQPPLPGRRLRPRRRRRHAAAGERLDRRPVHPARDRGPPVRPARRRAASRPGLRRTPAGDAEPAGPVAKRLTQHGSRVGWPAQRRRRSRVMTSHATPASARPW